MIDFNLLVRQRLRHNEWPQSKLCEGSGLEKKAIEQILRRNNPTLRNVQLIAQGFGISVAELLSVPNK